MNFRIIGQETGEFDELVHAGPVIQSLACHHAAAFAQKQGGVLNGDGVAHLNPQLFCLIPAGGAYVYEEVAEVLGHLCAESGSAWVDVVHYSIHMACLRLYDHMLAEELLGKYAGQRLDPEKAMVVDMAHDEADLIQMGNHGHLLSLAGAVDDQVVEVVRLIGESLCICQKGAHQRLRLVFKAGGSHRLAQRSDPGPQILFQLGAVKSHLELLHSICGVGRPRFDVCSVACEVWEIKNHLDLANGAAGR